MQFRLALALLGKAKIVHHFFYLFKVIEDFHSHFKAEYGASPDFYIGTLDEAMHAAFGRNSIEEVRLVPS
jgi:hypothetical protein